MEFLIKQLGMEDLILNLGQSNKNVTVEEKLKQDLVSKDSNTINDDYSYTNSFVNSNINK